MQKPLPSHTAEVNRIYSKQSFRFGGRGGKQSKEQFSKIPKLNYTVKLSYSRGLNLKIEDTRSLLLSFSESQFTPSVFWSELLLSAHLFSLTFDSHLLSVGNLIYPPEGHPRCFWPVFFSAPPTWIPLVHHVCFPKTEIWGHQSDRDFPT